LIKSLEYFVEAILMLLDKSASGEILPPSMETPLDDLMREDINWASQNLLCDAVSTLSHFRTDGDIRAKDLKYDQYQRDQLRDCAAKIRRHYKLP
jgi:hypothetical protein